LTRLRLLQAVSHPEKQGEETVLTVARIPGWQTVKTFRLPDKKMFLQQIGWLPDGSGKVYLSNDQKFENVILWKQPLDETAPRRIVNLGKFEASGYILPVSPDGKTFSPSFSRKFCQTLFCSKAYAELPG
jgi:hypothetical protein